MTDTFQQPKVSHGYFKGEADYQPPFLFPRFSALDDYFRRQYVIDELLVMAHAKTLCATDLLTQRSEVRDQIGRILKNIVIDGHSERGAAEHEMCPQEIRYYPVAIRTYHGEKIEFKRGVVPRPDLIARGRAGIASISEDDKYTRGKMKNEDEWVDYGTKEATLPLHEAWIALSKHGRNCIPAPSQSRQKRTWLFEEVMPEQSPEAKRGRPRKAV